MKYTLKGWEMNVDHLRSPKLAISQTIFEVQQSFGLRCVKNHPKLSNKLNSKIPEFQWNIGLILRLFQFLVNSFFWEKYIYND